MSIMIKWRLKRKNMGTLYELTYDVSMKDRSTIKAKFDEIRTKNGSLPVSIGVRNDHETT